MRSNKLRRTWMRPLLPFFTTWALLNLSACRTAQVPVELKDQPLYYVKEASPAEWAVEMHFLTSGTTQISESDFSPILLGSVVMSLDSWQYFNGLIAKLCSQVSCPDEVKAQVNDFFITMQLETGRTFQMLD